MGRPWDRQTHTLPQLARRAGISEGRARALYTKPGGLPTPDRTDAEGRPLWWATTIDAWCASTGRDVNPDSLWLLRAPKATTPVPELQRGVVTLGGRRQNFYTIIWDTEHGHLIYLQALDGTGGSHKDWLAHHAAELIEPRWWPDAVVIMPIEEDLNFLPEYERPPLAYVYRLATRADEPDNADPGTGADGGPFSGLRRWLTRTAPTPASRPAAARARWEGQIDLADISAVIGRPIPVWLADTETSTNAATTLSYNRTFTVPDTVTEWPAAQQRLSHAVETGMPGEFPAAFAALAVDTAEGLTKIRAAHRHTADSGPGWYLVCRPAEPAPPIDLEQLITGARLVTNRTLVGKELTELRALEGELDDENDDEHRRGEVYAEAITLLEWQLRRAAKDAGEIRDLGHDYVPVADDGVLRYHAPWSGPVVEAWRKTLTPVDDLAATLRLRRVRRIIGDYPIDRIHEGYRDPEGRYVLVINLQSDHDWSLAEWPVSLQVTTHWTDKTVLAGDGDGGATTLMALTPANDGSMRVDPVPLAPRSDRDAFGYGYGGGTPGTTYHALLRCALPDQTGTMRITLAGQRDPDNQPASQLWHTISTTTGPLRLSWPQLQLWASADRKAAQISRS